MDFWQRVGSLAEEAAKHSQELTNGISVPSKLSDVVSEASKHSMEIATEASRKSKEITAEALKCADQIKSQIPPAAVALSNLVDVNSPPAAPAVSRIDLEKFGVTNDLRDFVKGITLNTFRDFPIEGRGVDLNRNWSVDWGKKEKDYDPYEENPVTAPFSEPETQVIRKLSMSFEPHIWVNVHSGIEDLFMPYEHKNRTPDGYPSQRMRSILEKMNHLHLGDRCLIGSCGGSVGYLAHSTVTDYMYDVAQVPMALTFEIYGDVAASSKDCFRMFNPMDITTFNIQSIALRL